LVLGIYQKTFKPNPLADERKWWLKHWRYLLLLGVPLLIIMGFSSYMLSIVLTRFGDGNNAYIYASTPQMQQTNICLYLSEDGMQLMEVPQNIWRMPTTDEVVRSLVRHGENTGCEWQGELRQSLSCVVTPDKESPLWSTDHPVIYYWTTDSYSNSEAYFVSYNGMVNTTRKSGGNPRHSYRCVKAGGGDF